MRSILALALLVVPAALVAEDKKPDADLKAMAGKWTVEKIEFDGTDVTNVFKGSTFVIADGKYTSLTGTKKVTGTISVDSGKDPKEMDMKSDQEPNKPANKTIYKLDKDTLTVCHAFKDAPRPTTFDAKPGSKLTIFTYKRAK
ncbi:MAG TPA: TIGR03067 domain-containing protein [Gemmataceae bacterium]|nr:TIGR03067 domain-containing protein [Gemmataceae bacterium]